MLKSSVYLQSYRVKSEIAHLLLFFFELVDAPTFNDMSSTSWTTSITAFLSTSLAAVASVPLCLNLWETEKRTLDFNYRKKNLRLNEILEMTFTFLGLEDIPDFEVVWFIVAADGKYERTVGTRRQTLQIS